MSDLYIALQVNEAVNDLLIDEEDFEGLKSSIASFDNFDQVGNRSGALGPPFHISGPAVRFVVANCANIELSTSSSQNLPALHHKVA